MVAELGIPLIMAKEEADTVLSKGGYDVIITSDSDLLILGSTILIPQSDYHYEINHEDFMKHVGLNQEQLYEMAFLSGCDVQPKKFLDIDAAISLLRFYGSLDAIQKKRGILNEADLDLWFSLKKMWSS
jgi:5'-3' exonuclease